MSTTPEATRQRRVVVAQVASARMQTRYLLIASVAVALVILVAGALWLLRLLS